MSRLRMFTAVSAFIGLCQAVLAGTTDFADLVGVINVPRGDVLNVREAPHSQATVIAVHRNWDLLRLSGTEGPPFAGRWVEVCVNSCMEQGWVHGNYLAPVSVKTIHGTKIPMSGFCIPDWETPHASKFITWSLPLGAAKVEDSRKVIVVVKPQVRREDSLEFRDDSMIHLIIEFGKSPYAHGQFISPELLAADDERNRVSLECFPDRNSYEVRGRR